MNRYFHQKMLLLMAFLMSFHVMWAEDTEGNFVAEAITTNPTPSTEYLEYYVCYYNSWGYDSYIPGDDYFVVWYDHEEVASTRALSGESNEYHNNDGSCVYSNSVQTEKNGTIRVEVYKFAPGHRGDSGEAWAKVRIYLSHLQTGVKHLVQFGANYKVNQGSVRNFVRNFEVSPTIPQMSSSNVSLTSAKKGSNTFKAKFADTSSEQEITLYKQDRKAVVNGKIASWGFLSYSSSASDYYARKSSGGNAASQSVQMDFAGSNYTPVKVFPRNRISGTMAYFHDYVDGIYTVHYPCAKSLQVTSDYWNRTVTLKWDKEWCHTSESTLSTDGKWMITRRKGNATPEYVKHIDYDKETYTIPASIETDYDAEYTYTVSFVPRAWGTDYQGATTDLLSDELSASTRYTMQRNFSFNNLTVTQKGDKAQVSWTCTPVALNQQAEFNVYKMVNDGSAKSVGTVMTKKDCGEYSFQDDIQNLTDKSQYYVKAELLDMTFTSETKEVVLENYSHITTLSATKGAYNDNVTLIWDVEQVDASNTYFKIERRVHSNYDSDGAQWKLLANMQGQDDQYTYVDTKAQNGIFYDYRVTSYCKNSNKQVRCEEHISDIGFCSQTGTISGKISYDGGTAVDSVRVILEPISSDEEYKSNEASLRCSNSYEGLQWKPTAETFRSAFGRSAYTMQMYLFPDSAVQSGRHKICSVGDSFFKLGDYNASKDEFTLVYGRDKSINGNIALRNHDYIKAQTYDHMIFDATSRTAHNWQASSSVDYTDYFFLSSAPSSFASFDLNNTAKKTEDLAVAIKFSSQEKGLVNNVFVDGVQIGSYTLTQNPAGYVENGKYYAIFQIPNTILVDDNGKAKDKLNIRLTAKAGNSGPYIFEARLVNSHLDDFLLEGATVPGITIPNKRFSHLTFALDNGTMTVTRINKVQNGLLESDSIQTASFADNCFDRQLTIPVVSIGDRFQGFIDDVRLFRRSLKQGEILRDFNHYLSGKERDLVAYWPFDDGILGTGYAYDRSFTNGDANNNHAFVMAGCDLNGIIPKTSELSFSAVTDANGDYIIHGVPYFSGGTNYSVRPVLGIHEFSPATKTCYFSDNSLVFNSNDFTDKSSFPVNGVAYYENTNHPVEGLMVYIDNSPVVMDGNIVTTSKEGTFAINVPIGNHYVQLKKDNHDMKNLGRWPETGTHLFDREVRNLTFTDQTLVTVAGRIDGGAIEYDKPLGMGVSENNIGQAVITLTSEYNINAVRQTTGLSSIFVPADTEREFMSPTTMVESTARTGKDTEDAVKTITITTDPATGEFAVKLPPLNYEIKSITVPSNPDLTFEGVQFPVALSATNVDMKYTDSIQIEDGGWRYFDYKTKYKLAYRTKPVVTFNQKGNPEGVYGEQVYDYQYIKENGAEPEKRQFPLLTYDEATKQVKYAFNDAPVFFQNNKYTFSVEGYELYVNHDGRKTKEFKVPLDNVSVTVSNEMSSENYIKYDTGELVEIVDGTFRLDSLGKGTYEFIAGFPRTKAPYTLGLSMSFKAGDVNYSWEASGFDDNKFKGIILGQRPYGSNFVTAGPDKLVMVLRDPPGSHSSMTWNKDSSIKHTNSRVVTHSFEEHSTNEHAIKTEMRITEGQMTPAGTITGIIAVVDETMSGGTLSLNFTEKWADTNTKEETFTTSTSVATSSDPMFDGPDADLYIGLSRNYLFGTAKKVGLTHRPDNSMTLGDEDILTMGDSLNTAFAYTKYYIVNTLIPNYRMMRNRLILPQGSQVTNKENYYRYVSDVPDDDPNFGKKGFYHTVGGILEQGKALLDSVSWCNSQIALWELQMARNEQAKVCAIENRLDSLIGNVSLSSGSTITVTNSVSKSQSSERNDVFVNSEDVTIDFNCQIAKFDLSNSIGLRQMSERSTTVTTARDSLESFTYTLEDGDPEDALSIDVYNAPDGYSPIFYTRAGQTSGNWEPQRLTEYYQPGKHEIMAQTMKNMVPRIYQVTDNVLTNVPSNGKAIVKVVLDNESETNVGGLFRLATYLNNDGCDVRCDGAPLSTNSLMYYLGGSYGSKEVTLEVSSVNKSALDCEILLKLTDMTQSDPLGPYPANEFIYPIKVSFVPSSSEIDLAADRALLNANGGGKVNFTLKDYDLNLTNLMNVSLEYRGESDANWKTYRSWSCNKADKSSETVLDMSSLDVAVDMSDGRTFPDQTYYFRARTASNFGGEWVYNYSAERSLLKDIEAPVLLGTPSPSDGLYKYNTEVYATFNEDIRSEIITKADNISLVGQLNDGLISHEVSLACNGRDSVYTEAKVTLPNTSVSFNAWVRWKGGGGSILAHGTSDANISVGVLEDAEDNRFYVKLNDNIYRSALALPKDEWLYLSVVVDGSSEDNRRLLCHYVTADTPQPVTLLTAEHVGELMLSPAKMVVGYRFRGNIHELTIWDYARPISVASHQKDKRLGRFTSHLVAYWPLNNGHGSVANELVREANLVLDGENNWNIESENYSLRLDRSDKVRIVPSANATTGSDDDYMLQLWFRADEPAQADGDGTTSDPHDPQTSDPQTILSIDGEKTALVIDGRTGALVLQGLEGMATTITKSDIRDGRWHHFTMMVHKSTNANATFFLDGNNMAHMSAQQVSNIVAPIFLGGNYSGYVDELRVASGMFSEHVIRESMYVRYSTDNSHMAIYYPFEVTEADDYGQPVTRPSATDYGTYGKGETHMTAAYVDGLFDELRCSATVVPPLRCTPITQDVKFDVVASERRITLVITEAPERIENCTLVASLRNITDRAGNVIDPVTWTFNVQHDFIEWKEKTMDETLYVGDNQWEHGFVTKRICNNTGYDKAWSLEGVPYWMVPSLSGGTLKPNEELDIRFEVLPAIGSSLQTGNIYLVEGTTGISHPLHYELINIRDIPRWDFEEERYQNTMTIIGQVVNNGVKLESPYNMVGAFNADNECVGYTAPVYEPRYDAYYYYLTVYGNAEETAPLRFVYYDSNKGMVYPDVDVLLAGKDMGEIHFAPNKMYGSLAAPLIWQPNSRIEQNTFVNSGWNWISFNTMDETPLDTLFGYMVKWREDGPVVCHEIVNEDCFSVYDESDGWMGTLPSVHPGTMYKVNMGFPNYIIRRGEPANASGVAHQINPGWNWLGATVSSTIPLSAAMADMSPVEGDVIKNFSSMSYFTNSGWVGPLKSIQPGVGYYYYSAADEGKSFVYPVVSVGRGSSVVMSRGRTVGAQTEVSVADYPARHRYTGTMTMVACVVSEGEPVGGVELRAYDRNGELRGINVSRDDNDRHLIYIVLHGDESADLSFSIVAGSSRSEYNVDDSVTFRDGQSLGTPASPFIFHLGESSGITEIRPDSSGNAIYDLTGRKVSTIKRGGIYISNGKRKIKN